MAFPPWTDASGTVNYMHNFQLMGIGVTPDAAPDFLEPSTAFIVVEGNRPFELLCANAPASFAPGNYSFFQTDPGISTSNYLLHIPHLVSGSYSFTNSAWQDTAFFDVSAGNFVTGSGVTAPHSTANTTILGGTNYLYLANSMQGMKINDGSSYDTLKCFSGDNGLFAMSDESGHQFASFGNYGVQASSGGLSTSIASTSGNYTIGDQDSTILVTTTGKTITLPNATVPNISGNKGRQYTIKLTVSGSCTIATTSSQTIDGASTYTLSAQYKYVTVQSDGANWWVIASN